MTTKLFLSVASLALVTGFVPPAAAIDLGVSVDAGAAADVEVGIGSDENGGAEGGAQAGAAADLTVDAGIDLGSGNGDDDDGEVGIAAGVQVAVGAGVGARANGVDADPVANVAAALDAFLDASVVTADDLQVGVVSDLETNADGSAFLVVDLDDAFRAGTDSIRLVASAHTVANHQVRLGATEAELRAAIQASLAGQAAVK